MIRIKMFLMSLEETPLQKMRETVNLYRMGEYANKKEYFCKLVAVLHLSLEIGWR